MIEYFMWMISFVTLYVSIVTLYVISHDHEEKTTSEYTPKITLTIPAWNEERTIAETLDSLLALHYPWEKLEIIVVNDASSDNTRNIVKTYEHQGIILIDKKINEGKGAALNSALAIAHGELFGCIDADTLLHPNAIQHMLHHFQHPTIGGVLSSIRIYQPNNIWRKVQHLEYIFTNFARNISSRIETLHITHGALTLFRTAAIRNVQGFDANRENLTEDLDIGIKLRLHHYDIIAEQHSISYTRGPGTFQGLWNQRIRWYRGFLYNNLKYKKALLFNKEHKTLGYYQIPVNWIGIVIVLFAFIATWITIGRHLYQSVTKFSILRAEYFNWGGFKDLILSIDIKIVFPIIIIFGLALYIYHRAHKFCGEQWKYPHALALYITLYPMFRSAQWVTSVYKEVTGAKKKWRKIEHKNDWI